MRRPLPFAILVPGGVALDQLSKHLVFQRVPSNASLALVPGKQGELSFKLRNKVWVGGEKL
jgi:hypothetical protein